MTALLIIDMQCGSFTESTPRYDADGVVERINALAEQVRKDGGPVIFIQHAGPVGDTFEPGSDGWRILPGVEQREADPVVSKSTCDSFCDTDLQELLSAYGTTRIIITGCATDFCVDTTIRAAVSRHYEVVVAEDGHTTADRPHLDAATVIKHHNWIWRDLIHPKNRVEVLPTETILAQLQPA